MLSIMKNLANPSQSIFRRSIQYSGSHYLQNLSRRLNQNTQRHFGTDNESDRNLLAENQDLLEKSDLNELKSQRKLLAKSTNPKDVLLRQALSEIVQSSYAVINTNKAARQARTNTSQALIYVNKKLIDTTPIAQAGTPKSGDYAILENSVDKKENALSKNDAEVETAQNVYNCITEHIAQAGRENLNIEIVFVSSSGPCHGCKERLRTLQQNIAAEIGTSSKVKIQSEYSRQDFDKERHGHPTQYGFTDGKQEQFGSIWRYTFYMPFLQGSYPPPSSQEPEKL